MKKRSKFIIVIAAMAVLLCTGVFGTYKVFAEQSGGSPESGVTSRIVTLYNDLTGLTFGSDSDTPDWGTYWNRIKTAAKWVPNGTATTSDVLTGKNFFNTTRTAQNGAYDATNLTAGTVKSGTLFGVGLTGQYPSATYPLTGAGTVATASNVASGKVAWSNDGTQITGAAVMAGPCPTQQWYDGHASATEANNCSLTWTANPTPVTGDDARAGRGGLDPRTGLTWSNLLLKTGTVVGFSSTTNTAFSWDASAATNQGITAPVAGNRTSGQLCADQGSGWRLPTQKELMQAYIDGAYFNLTQPSYYFWSATENSSTNAWYVNLYNGYTNYGSKTSSTQVRCVR